MAHAFGTMKRTHVRTARLMGVAVALATLLVLTSGARPAAADSFRWSVILSSLGSTDAISCPTTTACVVDGGFSNSWERVFNPFSPGTPVKHPLPTTTGVQNIACPSTTQCTAIDDEDSVITFNPASPGTPTETSIDNAPLISSDAWGVIDLACPSTTQCTGVDSQQSEVTFNPQSPPATPNPQVIDTSTASNANYEYYVSCPSLTQCTAIDGDNAEITFNPDAAPGHIVIGTHAFPSTFNISGVSCPTTSQCTDIYTYPGGGTDSYEVTFNPTAPGSPTPVALHFYAQGGSTYGSLLSCPSATQCTAAGVDAGSGTGEEVTFNPQAAGTPTAKVTNSSGSISCPSVSECAMTDGYGRVILGIPSSGGGGGGGGTPTASAGQAKVVGKTATALLTCSGSGASLCHYTLALTTRVRHKAVKVGSASISLSAGKSTTGKVHLNRKGRKLLRHHSPLKVRFRISASVGTGTPKVILTKTLRFKR